MNISTSCYDEISSPSYKRYLFPFERNFNAWNLYIWFNKHWTICLYIIAAYLFAIVAGKRYMRFRPPYQLRGPLIIWNVSLALFSVIAICRFFPAMVYWIAENGFWDTLCVPATKQHRQAGGVWVALFSIFKVFELGDTAFIILRKKPLIFLHWYHHISVLLFTWWSIAYMSAMQKYFLTINFLMHAFVYSYLAMKALKVRIPRTINIVITLMQILEMVVGIFVAFYSYLQKFNNPDCCVHDEAINIAALIYASYFLLFSNFFIKTYISNKGVLFDEMGRFKKSD